MATAASFLMIFGADEWDARVYDALSTTHTLAAAIRTRGGTLRVAYSLHKINKMLAEMLSNVHDSLEDKLPATPPAEPITPQRIQEAGDNLARLARMLEYLYEQSKRAGLTNNSLTAGSLNGIRKRVEQVKDLADWFDTAAHSEEVDAIFARSKEERERGEIFDLPQVE